MIKKLLGLLLITASAIAVDFYFFLNKPLGVEAEETYNFKPGTSVSVLARDLEKKKIISNRLYFSVWSRVTGSARKLKAGEYKISPDLNTLQLFTLMQKGKVRLYSLTLIEGLTFKQMMKLVNKSEHLSHHLLELNGKQIMQKIGHAGEHPEGRFFPDTYRFPKGMSDIDLLKKAYREMQKRLDVAWQKRDKNLPLKSAYEALTLASIVEKESAIAEERTRIAGVFVNRLRKGMRLQTDPTVIYGIGDKYKGNIRYKHLRTDTPYNTYTRKGLPPTPIAMPGQGALDAVSHPDKTEYIYFVAMSDRSGRHIFSTTLKDHEHAVDVHQRKRKKKAR
ncbi:MAG: endolytic transglycosylase MltG [endosymbiont of Galathealinum brachiosum]|uniref:Endolytic murein transglycosylase n=1 Tax=endosymbiont of Galathealinum brachiosum TaxID=2200906 RepID=A0A370DMI4_9GAMM|nr:MAG: endolytic transglycosylase MltG [endosymbiont of Galathealinum brachiosum]